MIDPAYKKKMVVVEGSYAVAHSAKICRPNVISAYPITPRPILLRTCPSL